MVGIDVCQAQVSDAAEACRVLRRSISEVCGPDYGHDPDIMAEWLANKTPESVTAWIEDPINVSVVAKHGDEVIGFAVLRENTILLNYVAPEYLRRGAGRLMLAALERHAIADGLTELRCVSTITARSFYEAGGFEAAGEATCLGNVIGEFPLRKCIAI